MTMPLPSHQLTEETPHPEPTFVLRASDPLALFALREYKHQLVASIGSDSALVDDLRELEAQFLAWQQANPQQLQPLAKNWL